MSSLSFFCISFRMPMFFFISGYFACSARLRFDASEIRYCIIRRMKMTLIPTAIFILLVYALFRLPAGESFYTWLCNPIKGGGWFTIVSFECFVIVTPFIAMYNSSVLPRHVIITIMLSLGVGFLFFYNHLLVNAAQPGDLFNILSNIKIFQLLFYFIAGSITRIILRNLTPPFVPAWCLVSMLAISFSTMHWIAPILRFGYYDWRLTPFILTFILGLLFLFSRLRFILSGDNIIGRQLSFLGRNTLQVFLMHLLLLCCCELDVVQSIYPWGNINPDHALPFTIILSMGITYMCVFLDKIFAKSPVYRYCYPKIPSQRPSTIAVV